MTFTLSRRGLVRLISFITAIILVLSLLAFRFYGEAGKSRLALEYHYLQSAADLSAHLQNIDSDLQKAMYAKTPAMLSGISAKLWREAGFAKSCLDALPIEYLELQNTNKLLSQVGDYCVSLSKTFASGKSITEEERSILNQLEGYCSTMLSEVLALNDGIQTGSISLTTVESNLNREFNRQPEAANVAEGFTEFEEGFTAYPTLIYDGPFSDHIMEKSPEYLKNSPPVSRAEARKKAAQISGLRETQLADGNDEEGKMPSYGFTSDGTDVSITKNGGHLCYLLKSREIGNRALSADEAAERAKKYMDSLDLAPMEMTYYEIGGNVMTVNYAGSAENALLYTDLIKVGVAMDNGEIVSYDARGFLTNHHERDGLTPAITAEQAKKSVSELLTIQKSQLCVIPSAGLNEVLCWEFQCKSEDGKNILVYVNAATGAEEQILILMIDENGQLTI